MKPSITPPHKLITPSNPQRPLLNYQERRKESEESYLPLSFYKNRYMFPEGWFRSIQHNTPGAPWTIIIIIIIILLLTLQRAQEQRTGWMWGDFFEDTLKRSQTSESHSLSQRTPPKLQPEQTSALWSHLSHLRVEELIPQLIHSEHSGPLLKILNWKNICQS